MSIKNILNSRIFQIALSALIIIGIVLSFLLPGVELIEHRHENPITDQEIQDITVLSTDENIGTLSTIIIPSGTGNEQTEQEPLEEEQEKDPENEQSPQPEDEQTDNPPDETEPEKEDTEESGDGAGDEGQEDGTSGDEGGEEAEPDLVMVMTWYKYGSEPKTIVCPPSETVTKGINTAQIRNDRLRYDFSLFGEDVGDLEIINVSYAEGSGVYSDISKSGEISVSVPEGVEYRNYTFKIETAGKVRLPDGSSQEQELTFTYVIRIDDDLDLDMELGWTKADGTDSAITCAADNSATKTIESGELMENVFSYTPKLVGTVAQDAQLVSGTYTTESGVSGDLSIDGGSLILNPALGTDSETYHLNFTAQVKTTDSDGESLETTVFFTFTIIYRQVLDAKLNFVWYEKGATARTLVCNPGDSAQTNVKNNQLSAGAVKYEMSLEGTDAGDGRILSVYYESLGTGGGAINPVGSLPMALPTGEASNTYTITVTALVGTQRIIYTIILKYSNDISLQMNYTVSENGASVPKQVTCENGKSATAEVIYDNQLSNGNLTYSMSVTGDDSRGVTITEVTCYRSGNGRTVILEPDGQVQLLLNNGKTGENTFNITAADTSGTEYEFTVNIPYKHLGEATVKIETNLTDGMTVTNETVTNLSVKAWSVDANGNVMNILATGTDTTLTVTLDGEVIPYATTSGTAQEYNLIPKNPETGDTNTHILYIYAEDSLGNFGELPITLIGQRSQAGQEKGTATLYIDMTTLGLGVQGPISYTVLADEPVSYAVAKAVWGYDAGNPFGTAENTFGWAGGDYLGTLDIGFYLRSMSPGGTVSANALSGLGWNTFGANDEEIFQYIDNKFGRGSGLASLWRCIYRNGLALSTATTSAIAEHDYTSGSGWVYSLNGAYYPGKSMSEFFLQPGDVLTLRYTLAYNWDIGGGTEGYGNNYGYCVTCLNGNISVNHQMQQQTAENGAISYVCKCCGLKEDCAHANIQCMDLGDGTHSVFCDDCKTYISDPAAHVWSTEDTDSAENHTCAECGLKEAHSLREIDGTNTATCTESGVRTMQCTICSMKQEQEAPAKGHQLDNTWYHNAQSHWQMCQVCSLEVTESAASHSYVYDSEMDDWFCAFCGAGHDWNYCGNTGLTVTSGTCQRIEYYCGVCGLYMYKDGTFEEYHSYTGGACIYCGSTDPSYVPPTEGEGEGEETEPEPETGE